jgi:Secretion system C-terminal sorting domain/Fibronectin type III domain/Cleaved Adhesin Domain
MKKLLLSLLFFFCFSISFSQTLLSESFENTTGPEPLPSTNWTLSSGNWKVFDNGVGLGERWQINNTSPNTGTNAAFINRKSVQYGNTSEDFLVTPLININANNNNLIRFSTKQLALQNRGTRFEIRVSATGQNPADFTTVLVSYTESTLNPFELSYVDKIIPIPSAISVPIYIAFVRIHTPTTSEIDSEGWFIDDVRIEEETPCGVPSNLSVTNISDTTVSLDWTSPETATAWQIVVLPAGSPAPTSGSTGIYVQTHPYILTNLTPQTCYTVYIQSNCNEDWSSPLNFCAYDCSDSGQCPDGIRLISFLDSNNNGVKDTGEVDFNLGNFVYKINDSGNDVYGHPSNGDFYILDSNPTNSYDFNFKVYNVCYFSYYSSANSNSNITIPTGSGITNYYFPIKQFRVLNEVSVYLHSSSSPRPGFAYVNTITYKNYGTETINSGTVSFTKSPVVSIVNISQSGTNTTASGFDYTFTNLAPFEKRTITIEMQVPTIPTVSLGDIITNSVSIEPIVGDAYPYNNNYSLSKPIVGSYDPNDITESHGEKILFDTFTADDYLYYTIRFENTGTSSAEFIRVEDVLHADLDESSFEMLNASHTINTKREGNKLTWHFYNINLPPSSSNNIDGQGFIYFRIKPKAGYAIGDIIPNTASIFFDYNPAIVTNTFNTEFVETLGNPTYESNNIVLYPNPASHLVTISSYNTNENLKEIVFYDIIGKRIKTISSITDTQTTIDLADIAKGVYMLEIITENNFKTVKKLVIQ